MIAQNNQQKQTSNNSFNTIYNSLIENATKDNTLYKKTIELMKEQVDSFAIDEDKKAKYLLEFTIQTALSFHQSASDKTINLLELEEKEKLTTLEVKKFNKEMQFKRDSFNSELKERFLLQKYQNRVEGEKFKKEYELKIKTFNSEVLSKFLLLDKENRVELEKFKKEYDLKVLTFNKEMQFKRDSFNKDMAFNNAKFTKEIELKQNIAQMDSDTQFNLTKYKLDVEKLIEDIKESNRTTIELAKLNTQISLNKDDNATRVSIANADPQGVKDAQKQLYKRQALGFNENLIIKRSEHISQVLSMALANGLDVNDTAWSEWKTSLDKVGDGFNLSGDSWIKVETPVENTQTPS